MKSKKSVIKLKRPFGAIVARLYKLRPWWVRGGHLSTSPGVVTSVWSIGDRAVGLGESGWWWTTGLGEPGGDRSVRRGDISGGRTGGDNRIRVDWDVTASGVWVGSVRFIMGDWAVWDWAGLGLGKSSGDRTIRRGEISGGWTGGGSGIRVDGDITATGVMDSVSSFIMGDWPIRDWTGFGEFAGNRSVRRGDVSRGWTGGNSGQRGNRCTTTAAVRFGRFIMGNWTIWDRTRFWEFGGDGPSRRGNIGRWRTSWNSGQNGNWDTTEAADESCTTRARFSGNGWDSRVTESWTVWGRATGLGESGGDRTTGIYESGRDRSVRRRERPIRLGHVGGDWSARRRDRSTGDRIGRDAHVMGSGDGH